MWSIHWNYYRDYCRGCDGKMRYCVKGSIAHYNGNYGILKICNTFNGAMDVVKKYRNGEDIQNGNFRYALEYVFFLAFWRMSFKRVLWLWKNTFGRYDYYGFNNIRTITINEDNLVFSWALNRKEVEKIYKIGVI